MTSRLRLHFTPRLSRRVLLFAGLGLALIAPMLHAHGFGQRVDLPIPLWLWMVGAGLTVILSFAAVIDFLPESLSRIDYPRYLLGTNRRASSTAVLCLLWFARTTVVGLFVLSLSAGLLGDDDPVRNFAPSLIWIVFWVGVAFASALIGDVWALLNPLRTIALVFMRVYETLMGRSPKSILNYPQKLAYWPALLQFVLFAWGEHLWTDATVPSSLAVALLGYSVVCLCAMALFGRETWLQNGDPFGVIFNLFARFAPLEIRITDTELLARCNNPPCTQRTGECVNGYVCLSRAAKPSWSINLRAPAVGLLGEPRHGLSLVTFILFALSSVSFDGFIETPSWRALLEGPNSAYSNELAFFVFPLGFLGLFLSTSWCAAWLNPGMLFLNRETPAALQVAERFVLSLIPIAIAYHLAHYLSALLELPDRLSLLLSPEQALTDTDTAAAGLTFISVESLWYVIVIAIIGGHILSVYLAHVIALDCCDSKKAAIKAETPLLVLMVCYTLFSLWILAQPLFL